MINFSYSIFGAGEQTGEERKSLENMVNQIYRVKIQGRILLPVPTSKFFQSFAVFAQWVLNEGCSFRQYHSNSN